MLIIDCDVRRRGLNRLIKGSGPRHGLLEVLSGEAALSDALVQDDETPAMILPLGSTDRDQSDLMTGAAMDNLLSSARERFDLIVLDTAPILPIADTRSLAAKADVVIIAVLWRKTQEQAVRAALRLLPRQGVNVAGIFLTKVDMRKQAPVRIWRCSLLLQSI